MSEKKTITCPGYNKRELCNMIETFDARIPKAGVYAEAGIGRAGAEASLAGLGAMARAEVASASAKAGPVGVKVGLGLDTGASVGLDGVEAKVLGTGIKIGPKPSVSVLGSEVECSVM